MTFHLTSRGAVCLCVVAVAIGGHGTDGVVRGAEIDALWATDSGGCLNLGHDVDKGGVSANIVLSGEGLLHVPAAFDRDVPYSESRSLLISGELPVTEPSEGLIIFDAIPTAIYAVADGPTMLATAAGIVLPKSGSELSSPSAAASADLPPERNVRLAGYRPSPGADETASPKALAKASASSEASGAVGISRVATIHRQWWNDVLEFKADSRGAELPALRR